MAAARVIETHISRVFITPERAYKMLKPVDAGFVDFTDRETRLAATTAEYELNRRMAPDVYLGLADVHEGSELVDRMVVMRTMPADRRLELLLRELDSARVGSDAHAQLRERLCGILTDVARTVAAFHASCTARSDEGAAMATRDSVARHWQENFDAIEPHVGTVIPPGDFAEVHELANRWLAASEELFARRIEAGWVRDGHGDLRAEDIFCLDDGPRILDCLGFAEEYRISDVLADIAFLAMDVMHLAPGDAALADELMARYHEFSDESHPESLARHYIAYRAHVRVKIACLKIAQGDTGQSDGARSLHRLALDQLRASRRRLVLVGGPPGTGKSTVSRAISDGAGFSLCVSDEIRKDLAGIDHLADASAAPGEGIYTAEATGHTYRVMLEQARSLLACGESVVLDASWSSEAHRDAARAVAADAMAELVEVRCETPVEVAKARVLARTADPSDATPDTVDFMASSFDPWPTARTLDTSPPAHGVAAAALELLEAITTSRGG